MQLYLHNSIIYCTIVAINYHFEARRKFSTTWKKTVKSV